MKDHRDAVIEMLADSEARQQDTIAGLIDIIADLAAENFVLRTLAARHLVEQFHGNATIAKLRALRGKPEAA